MALSDKYRKKREAVASERERLAVERAQGSIKRIMQSEQFRLSALALPESQMAVDAIVTQTVKSTLDPKGAFLDTVRAKGFRPAEIRMLVRKLYTLYCIPVSAEKEDLPAYEEMLDAVALHIDAHQELYNTLDPEELRG